MKIILKFKRLLLLIIFIKYASAIEVAITVDDLPSHGDLPNDISRTKIAITMLAAFKKHDISGVYGFINGYNVTDQAYILAYEYNCKCTRSVYYQYYTE
jgi:hypothetical protein